MKLSTLNQDLDFLCVRMILNASTSQPKSNLDGGILLEFFKQEQCHLVLSKEQDPTKLVRIRACQWKMCQLLAIQVPPGDTFAIQISFPFHSIDDSQFG